MRATTDRWSAMQVANRIYAWSHDGARDASAQGMQQQLPRLLVDLPTAAFFDLCTRTTHRNPAWLGPVSERIDLGNFFLFNSTKPLQPSGPRKPSNSDLYQSAGRFRRDFSSKPETKWGKLIRLQRIYNFLLFHVVILSILNVLYTFTSNFISFFRTNLLT